MAGLMSAASGNAPAAQMNANRPDEGEGPAAPGQGAGEPNVTPEEQAQYDKFVTNAMNMMYDEKTSKSIVQSLSTATSPSDGLGRTLAMIVMRVEDAARDKGVKFSGDVMLHAAEEILEQLVEMGEAAKIKEYSQEDIEAALYLGMDTYRSTRQEEGRLPVDEISQDFEELMAAERNGQLDEVAPGISEYAQGVEIPNEMAGEPERGVQ